MSNEHHKSQILYDSIIIEWCMLLYAFQNIFISFPFFGFSAFSQYWLNSCLYVICTWNCLTATHPFHRYLCRTRLEFELQTIYSASHKMIINTHSTFIGYQLVSASLILLLFAQIRYILSRGKKPLPRSALCLVPDAVLKVLSTD